MLDIWPFLCRAFLVALLLFGAAEVQAQPGPAASDAQQTGPEQTAPERTPGSASAPVTERGNGDPAVQALIRALEDPEARARLLEALRAPAQTPPATEDPAASDTEADTEAAAPFGPMLPRLGPLVQGASEGEPAADAEAQQPTETVISRLVDRLRAMLIRLADFATNAADISTLWHWLKTQSATPETRAFWFDFLASLTLTLGAASLGYWAVLLVLNRLHRRLRQRAKAAGRRRRIRVGLVLAVLELAPVASFWAIAFGLAGSLYFPLRTELVAGALVAITGEALLLVGLARLLLRPHTPYLRAIPIADRMAGDLYGMLRWLIFWSLLGYGLFSNISRLRVPPGVFEGLERIWGLVILGTVLAVLLRYREEIGRAITGDGGGRLARLRWVLAQIWLPAAILYGVGAYLIWALDVYQGAALLVRGGILSVLILLAVPPVSILLSGWIRSMQAADLTGPAALLQSRLVRYAGLLRALLALAVYVLAVLALGYAWGLDPIGWVQPYFSGNFMAVAGDIAFVLLICWGLWEAFDLWFTLYLDRVDDTGAPVQRSARTMTLLPLLRTTVVVMLFIAFLVATLTSLGLDVTPLLATAGVLGIAVGFGAQKLVQDVITGLFMLFQNTVSVGDWVTLGGYLGEVERITVRTLELRDLDGTLHTIPFSSVTTVSNMAREFAHAMLDIPVSLREDFEVVVEVLLQAGAEFEQDPVHGQDILGSLEILGLQDLNESSMTVRCRFRTRPMTQWGIRRAFLARVKHRFDELGIEIPFPQRTLHWGTPAQPAGSGDQRSLAKSAPDGDLNPTSAEPDA